MIILADTRSEHRTQTIFWKRRFAILAGLYALAVVYASLIVGPFGFHFVPIGFGEAWHTFLGTHFVDNASNQRADWTANMIMLMPLAYLLNGAFQQWINPADNRGGNFFAAALSLVAGIVFVLAVKYAQLFFPPRTVTLNYITAQSLGVAIGIVIYRIFHRRFYPMLRARFADGEGLTILLGAYTVWLIVFFLMPFDFVLSAGDLAQRLFELPTYLASLPGAGHGPVYSALLILADILAIAPVGMYLAVTHRDSSFPSLLLRGIALIVIVTFLSLFILGASPYAAALLYRTLGVALGIWFMRKLRGKDLRKRHYYFSRYIPVAMPVYVVLVMFASGVLSNDWVTLSEAKNALEARQFLPFWNFYIVSKAHAAQSFVVMLLIFAPIGVMMWVRRGFWARGAGFSAFLAFSLSMTMEIGRLMKPSLRPDFSDPLIAAAGAALAFKAMPTLWRMFEREAKKSGTLDSYIAEQRLANGKSADPAGATQGACPPAATPIGIVAPAFTSIPPQAEKKAGV